MKAIVLKGFLDKETGEIREKGDEIDVTAKRFAAINKHRRGPFLEEKGKGDKPPVEAPAESPTGC